VVIRAAAARDVFGTPGMVVGVAAGAGAALGRGLDGGRWDVG
jgi:hypothetical protein